MKRSELFLSRQVLFLSALSFFIFKIIPGKEDLRGMVSAGYRPFLRNPSNWLRKVPRGALLNSKRLTLQAPFEPYRREGSSSEPSLGKSIQLESHDIFTVL